MENISALTKLLREIKKLSEQIIVTALPIMRAIEPADNEIVATLTARVPGSEEHALKILQDIALEWVKDAEFLRMEVDNFVLEENDSFRLNTENCPVLAEVWSGDAYDKSGIEGLKSLRDDLKKTLGSVNEETLMKRAITTLSGEEDE